jgi:two-component system CheB/CheR fusion protein
MDNRKNDSEADLPERKEKTDNFIIVGVGASAGGLEAFSLFLSSLPAVINMAFILVQHLDPAHESELCTILSRTTSLPVIEVVDGLRILPNHIYVIPPNNLMTISGHILHLSPRVKSSTPFLSIDYFFKSLASEHKELSVGIVLSGSGIDGTSGIKEIKAAGGITFAQDKSSAKFDSMPEHAIESGDVDFVLPPSEIIQTLIRISRKYHLIKITEEQEIFNNEKDSFKKILYLLLTTAGVDFSAYRYTTIIRRIKRRMVVHGKENLAEYTKFLEDNPIEINTLFKEMLINVTSFFRDAEVFEELRKNILPPILKSKVAGGVFRVWVPGCSTGQEAYTIAMIIIECLDGLDKELSIQIFATDLSDSYVLEKARAGIYPNTIEAEVSPERLGRFFKKENGNYIISKPIREMCIFSKHNVVLDPPFSKIDLISCRNLLIYFSLALQQKVVQTFHYALNPEGLLLLGVAETIGSLTNLFISSNLKYRIYSRKAYAPQYPNFSTKGYISRISVASSPPITTISVKDWQNEADRVVLTKYSPSGILLNEELDILQFRGRTSPYLEAAPGAPSRNLLHMASEGMYFPIHNAIDQCRKDGLPVQRKGVLIRQMGQTYEVAFQVCPITLPESAEKCYLILFDKAIPSETMKASEDKSLKDQNDIIIQLHADLFSMNEYIQSIIEQKNELNDNLKLSIEEMLSSNEELQSTNEELQSTNEELETAKEEIQSVNEELVTLNDQLTNLNKELQESSDYAMAIVDTIREPLIVLDQSLRVQNVNQAFYDVFKATPDKTLDYSLWD